ncbi:unnamed protein product, partial [marine sediment metagenome]
NGEGPTTMLRWVGTPDEPFKGGNYLQTGDGKGAGWDVVSASELALVSTEIHRKIKILNRPDTPALGDGTYP